jgi:hypothetical protein
MKRAWLLREAGTPTPRVVAIAILTIILVGCAQVPASDASAAAQLTDELPADEAQRIGISGPLAPLTAAVVTPDEALAIARREASGFADAATETTAHLYQATISSMPEGVEKPVDDRLVWIVRYAGIHYQRSDASQPPGAPPPSVRILDHAYVYVDAVTGEYLATALTV